MVSLFPLLSYADSGITIDQSFTYEDGYWKPGRVETKDFYINNNKENDISIDRLYINLKSSEYWKTGEKLDINSKQFKEFARYSTATLKHDNTVLFQDTLENLLSRKGINLSKDIDIKANGKELSNMTIDMDTKMNNDAQSLDSVFTFSVAYKVDSGKSHNKHGHGGIVKPDSTDENDDIVKPDIIDENDDIVKPDNTVKNDDIVKPNDGDRHNNIKNSYHRVENNNIINSNNEIGSNNANKSNVDIGKNEVNKLPQNGGIINIYSLYFLLF